MIQNTINELISLSRLHNFDFNVDEPIETYHEIQNVFEKRNADHAGWGMP